MEVKKRYSYLVGINGLGILKKRKLGIVGCGPRNKQAVVCLFAKARKQNIIKKQVCFGSKIQGVVFLWVNVKGSELVNRRR